MKKLTIQEVQNRIKDRFPNETFEILKYSSMGEPGTIRCCNCNKIIEISKFSNFFATNKKNGCSSCQSNHVK